MAGPTRPTLMAHLSKDLVLSLTERGLLGREAPLLTIQYHSEASPGPLDNMYLFERFVEMVADARE